MVRNYQIEMLDVADADAFIVYVEVDGDIGLEKKLILVDAGRYHDGDKILSHFNKYYPGRDIDLAIVTHCDDDHFGGFIRILELMSEYEQNSIKIRKFLINDPRNLGLTTDDFKKANNQDSVDNHLKMIFGKSKKSLLDMIETLKIPKRNAFADVITFNDMKIGIPSELEPPFDFITVLGPTEEYFKSLIPTMRKHGLNSINESSTDINDLYTLDENALLEGVNRVDKDESPNNQSSIILMMDFCGKKYLFTGDAGEKAFANMTSKHFQDMANVHWLKVPHHGSDRNLSKEIIQHLNPKIAYVSTKKIGHYLSQDTIDALKAVGCKVYSTHVHKSMIHHRIVRRHGYKVVQPL